MTSFIHHDVVISHLDIYYFHFCDLLQVQIYSFSADLKLWQKADIKFSLKSGESTATATSEILPKAHESEAVRITIRETANILALVQEINFENGFCCIS